MSSAKATDEKKHGSPLPRIAAIHDLSGFGRASLTVIIPILSTLGVQVCPLPTAVLSTHTGGFKNYHIVDLTDQLNDLISHWKSLDLYFDAIYSGFLGSYEQIDIVSDFITDFARENQIVQVDPVMGDDGHLYTPIDTRLVEGMRKLIEKATIITPNFTEASFLLDKEYETTISDQELRDRLVRLSDMGPEIVIITSVPRQQGSNVSSVMAYNRNDHRFWRVNCTYIPAYYPGTGDAFASVVLGGLLQGDSLPIALDRAVQFVTICIKASYGYDIPRRDGVLLEKVLDNLKAPLTSVTYEIAEEDC